MEGKSYKRINKGDYRGLGAARMSGGVNFALAADTEEPVSLLIYKKGERDVFEEIPFPDKPVIGSIYAMKLEGFDPHRYEYNFQIDGCVMPDPYARRITGRPAFGEPVAAEDIHRIRSGFVTQEYHWEDDKGPDIPYEDVISYNLHVRGFTKHSSSKVRHKGTFLGLQEKIPYLKELGVNQVKLMPVYDFAERMELSPHTNMNYKEKEVQTFKINYWGYGNGNYFAPKEAYSYGKDAVREFKDMVKAFHTNGLEVIMEFSFPKDVNPRLISSCLAYWAVEYHIDGFHLLCDEAVASLVSKDPILSSTKLLGIYFPDEARGPYESKKKYRNTAECNDGFMIDMRCFLKGDEGMVNAATYRLRRNPSGSGVINYITNHDGFTLADLVSYNEKHNEENREQNLDGPDNNYSWNCGAEGKTKRRKVVELRMRQVRNALALLLLGQGAPMLLAGDEMGNTQNGNNNAYCQDNMISWLNWNMQKANQPLWDFTKGLIGFRKKHRILHMPSELKVMDTMSCGYPDLSYHGDKAWYGDFADSCRHIGLMYCGEYAGEDEFIYIAINMHWEEQHFALPNLNGNYKWYKAIDTAYGIYEEEEEPVLEDERYLKTDGRNIVVLIGRQKPRRKK